MCTMGVEDAHRGAQKQRVACALKFLMRCCKEGDGKLSHIVTGDEICSGVVPLFERTKVRLGFKLFL